VVDFEKGVRTPRAKTIDAICAALEQHGVKFIEENGDGVGVRMKK